MQCVRLRFVSLVLLTACGVDENPQPAGVSTSASPRLAREQMSLREARRGFKTGKLRQDAAKEPVPEPPQDLFRLVRYDSPVGPLAAYLTPDPGDGAKHPAIIWITGGDCNSIDRGV